MALADIIQGLDFRLHMGLSNSPTPFQLSLFPGQFPITVKSEFMVCLSCSLPDVYLWDLVQFSTV